MGGAGGEAVGTAGGGEEGGAVVYGCDFACCVWVMSMYLSSDFFSCCSRCFFFLHKREGMGKGEGLPWSVGFPVALILLWPSQMRSPSSEELVWFTITDPKAAKGHG